MTRDFVEEERDWDAGEREEFVKGKDRDDILDYFLSHNDSGPHREYSAMSYLEYEHLSFIRPAGRYEHIGETKYNYFDVIINRDSDLDKAEEELSWAFNKIADFYPDVSPLKMGVSEHTLSAQGSYYIFWDRVNKFEIGKYVYSRKDSLRELGSLRELIEYIAVHHYYE